MGVVQLSGFPEWKIIHVIHHSNPDHPELDPHPPLLMTYWQFAKGMRDSIARVFVTYYFKCFGKEEAAMKGIKRFGLASRLNMFMKVTMWYLLLGPQLFTFLFLSSVAFKMLHFAWFNYATHRPTNDKFEIKNLDHRLYTVINWISFGLYYHDNHHTNPSLFNPKKMPPVKEKKGSVAA
jgi:fatty-acid desaturase